MYRICKLEVHYPKYHFVILGYFFAHRLKKIMIIQFGGFLDNIDFQIYLEKYLAMLELHPCVTRVNFLF